MDRYARRQHFEALCRMRDAYARLDGLDTMSLISIDEVIELAVALMECAEATTPASDADAGPDRTTSER